MDKINHIFVTAKIVLKNIARSLYSPNTQPRF